MKKNILIREKLNILRLVKFCYYVFALVYCGVIIHLSFSYFPPDFSEGFLIGKQLIFGFYKFFFYTHIITAPVCFIIALSQLLFNKSKLHKIMGVIYVILVLFFAAPSGLIMSFFALGSYLSVISFVLLSLLWSYTTLMGFLNAKAYLLMSHKVFMTRSFILANSAILLRIFMYLNQAIFNNTSQLAYDIISIVSWLPFLLVFEVYNSKKNA